jgi:hypothetical protein
MRYNSLWFVYRQGVRPVRAVTYRLSLWLTVSAFRPHAGPRPTGFRPARNFPSVSPLWTASSAKRGWTIAAQIQEVGSGASERELREKLLAAARRRESDVVLVWRLDRWGRSLVDLLVTLQELAECRSRKPWI